MQIDYIDANGKYPIEINQIVDFIVTVNNIINDFHDNNLEIIYLRNLFRKNDFKNRFRNYAVVEGTLGVKIDPRINILSENIFDKYAPDALTNNDVGNFLIQYQINELYLCGVLADECVYETALGAINKGYIVNYFSNGVVGSSIKNKENAIRKLKNRGVNIIEF